MENGFNSEVQVADKLFKENKFNSPVTLTDELSTENEFNGEIQLVGELFRELLDKLNKAENKKKLYKGIDELTLAEINTIIIIGRTEMISMSALANSLGVSFGTPTITIDRLIKKDVVERIRDIEDRRQVFIKLSDSGKVFFDHIMILKKRLAEKIFGILTPEESKISILLLSKLNNNFYKIFEND